MKAANWMRTTLLGGLALMVGACASIGRPEGGPRDETPPVYVRANPEPGSTNVSTSKINIFFDENLKLEDPANKFVVSPAQRQNPRVSANGRRITVELLDSMLPNTTYTLDFSDAIRDLNESNILDGFSMAFATGDTIDTLSISGMVFAARNLEPAQAMVVGVYSNLADSAVRTLPLERVAKTNQYGQFSIRNLKPGTYNVFAIDDRNHDWHWDRSENIAFSSVTVSPSVESVMVNDTLRAADGTDSIVSRQAWHYLPDDVLLTWFSENYTPQYLRGYERTDRQRVTIKLGAKTDTMPEFTIINGPRTGTKLADISVIETREGLDSLVYWIRDTLVTQQDSLMVQARYQKTDSLEQLQWMTDTIKLFVRSNVRQLEKERIKAREKAIKEREERIAHGDTVPELEPDIVMLNFKALSQSSQDINLPVIFEADYPVEHIDSAGWRLEMKVDTVWTLVPNAHLTQDTTMLRRYNLTIDAEWPEDVSYRFTADSLAITDIYGHHISNTKHEFKVKLREEYGNIIFNITDLDQVPDSAILMIELLNQSDEPVATLPTQMGETVFNFVKPGTYYARAYIDLNRNGLWDTGNMAEHRQPEDVFYFTKKLNLRKNWDINQDWAIFETPVDAQKPLEITKNKPQTRDKKAKGNLGDEEEDEFEDESGFDQDGFGNNSWGNGSTYNNARRNNSNLRSNSNVRRTN